VVRHPIYLGLMIAAIATAVLFGQITAFLGAVLLSAALVAKVLLEERAMDDAAHRDYRRRVPLLVPFPADGRKRRNLTARVEPFVIASIQSSTAVIPGERRERM